MPELPEVETIRRQLEKLIVGQTIPSVEVLNPGSFRADPDSLIGKTITGVERKGKVLILSLKRSDLGVRQGQTLRNREDFRLYIHLKMSGQLRYRYFKISISSSPDNRHLRVLFKFSNGDCLEFHDQRKFGWITDVSSILPLGIDALDPKLTVKKLEKILESSNRPVKTILLDQSKIAGIGNIYASEILWEAGISPFKKGRALSQRQGPALIKSIKKTLTEAIKYGGSTMGDGLYQHVGGESGNYWPRRRVYDREGEPCLRCQTPVKKGFIGQRSIYWCPGCQVIR